MRAPVLSELPLEIQQNWWALFVCVCVRTTIHYRSVEAAAAIASDERRAPGLLLCSRLHGNNDILMMAASRMRSLEVDYKWVYRS